MSEKRRRRKIYLSLVVIFSCILLLVMSVGNPQWSKYIYVWQCHYLNQADGSQGEIQLTDGIQALIQTSAAYGCEYEGIRLDIGSGIDFIRANILAALERPQLNQQCVEMIENLQALIKPQ